MAQAISESAPRFFVSAQFGPSPKSSGQRRGPLGPRPISLGHHVAQAISESAPRFFVSAQFGPSPENRRGNDAGRSGHARSRWGITWPKRFRRAPHAFLSRPNSGRRRNRQGNDAGRSGHARSRWGITWPKRFRRAPHAIFPGPIRAVAEIVGATTPAARATPDLAGASRGPSDFRGALRALPAGWERLHRHGPGPPRPRSRSVRMTPVRPPIRPARAGRSLRASAFGARRSVRQ